MKVFFSLFLSLSLFLNMASAQKSYITRNGKISFLAIDDDDIKAVNNEVTSRLSANGQLTFSLLVKGFKFDLAEMQEHFNDNYMESTKYPRAEFKGNISNIKNVNIAKDGVYPVTVSGDLTMHGVTQKINSKGTVTVKGRKISAESKFSLTLEQFKISGGLLKALTKSLTVTVNCQYQ